MYEEKQYKINSNLVYREEDKNFFHCLRWRFISSMRLATKS